MIRIFSNGYNVEFKSWTFPGGERNVQVDDNYLYLKMDVTIFCSFRGSDDIIDLMLLVNAIRNVRDQDIHLVIPYFPAARQDRVMNGGECFAAQVYAQLINQCKFKTVSVYDPHSDVLAALFDPGVLRVHNQWDIWADHIESIAGKAALVSPDAGALKKIYKLAHATSLDVIEASKHRDTKTGKITHTSIDASRLSDYDQLIVVDDICDGGATFNELAKVIRAGGFTGKLVLCVTHGIFSRGVDAIEGYDKICTAHVMFADVASEELMSGRQLCISSIECIKSVV